MSSAPSEASGTRNPLPASIPPICSARPVGSHEHVLDPQSRDASDDDNVHLKESGRDSKSAAMNRKRIVIKPIADERSRVGTYNKRKFGVIKKAMELSILCKCKIGLFIFSESGKPVRYCSDGDFRSLVNSVAQGSSGTPRSGSAEVWDNSMYTSFNRGFSSSGKGDDDFPFDSSLLQEPQDMQGGAAKRPCTDPPAAASAYQAAMQEHNKLNSPANLLPLGMVAPPLRVSSPLVLSSAATMHSRSQSSSGPNFSAAPMLYSTPLDESFMNSVPARQAPFMFEDRQSDHDYDAFNAHITPIPNSYEAATSSAFAPLEADDSVSLQSGYSNQSNNGNFGNFGTL